MSLRTSLPHAVMPGGLLELNAVAELGTVEAIHREIYFGVSG